MQGTADAIVVLPLVALMPEDPEFDSEAEGARSCGLPVHRFAFGVHTAYDLRVEPPLCGGPDVVPSEGAEDPAAPATIVVR
jgi:hypothetical protein